MSKQKKYDIFNLKWEDVKIIALKLQLISSYMLAYNDDNCDEELLSGYLEDMLDINHELSSFNYAIQLTKHLKKLPDDYTDDTIINEAFNYVIKEITDKR